MNDKDYIKMFCQDLTTLPANILKIQTEERFERCMTEVHRCFSDIIARFYKIYRGEKMIEVKKYRKKPVVIEAIQYDGTDTGFIACCGFIDDIETSGKPYMEIVIKTLEGDMIASKGDYIIKGIKGEFYPCKADIFEATYDLVEDKE